MDQPAHDPCARPRPVRGAGDRLGDSLGRRRAKWLPLRDGAPGGTDSGVDAPDAARPGPVRRLRALEAGASIEETLGLVRASGLPVAAVGVERGWFYAEGEARRRLLGIVDEVCRWATTLDAPIIMSPCDPAQGDLDRAAASVRE